MPSSTLPSSYTMIVRDHVVVRKVQARKVTMRLTMDSSKGSPRPYNTRTHPLSRSVLAESLGRVEGTTPT